MERQIFFAPRFERPAKHLTKKGPGCFKIACRQFDVVDFFVVHIFIPSRLALRLVFRLAG